MSLSKEALIVFKDFQDPILGQTYLELGWVKKISDKIQVRLGYPETQEGCSKLETALSARLKALGEDHPVEVGWKVSKHKPQGNLKPKDGIKNVIAVGSGKGGVGKSTISANLACALSALGAKVGILDADIYGPSQPHIFSAKQKPEVANNQFIPLTAHGVSMLSMGCLVEEDNAMIWRGPMVSGALLQLFDESTWPDLDYLILDLPPGTGDIQLTMAQKLPVAGAVVVTTPQDLSLLDAKKAISMFQKVDISVLGIVENMSGHVCEACGHTTPLFGQHGGEHLAAHYHVPLLAEIPLTKAICDHTECGVPTVVKAPESKEALQYINMAQRVAASLSKRPVDLNIHMKLTETA